MDFDAARDRVFGALGPPFLGVLLVLDLRDGELSAGGGVVVIVLGGFIGGVGSAVVRGLARTRDESEEDEQWRD